MPHGLIRVGAARVALDLDRERSAARPGRTRGMRGNSSDPAADDAFRGRGGTRVRDPGRGGGLTDLAGQWGERDERDRVDL